MPLEHRRTRQRNRSVVRRRRNARLATSENNRLNSHVLDNINLLMLNDRGREISNMNNNNAGTNDNTHVAAASNTSAFNSIHLFYAMAPKQSLNFMFHTTMLGTVTSLLSVGSITWMSKFFDYSFLQIFVKNNYPYLTFWFVATIYIQLFSFIQRLVVVKNVSIMLYSDVLDTNLMTIDEIDAYYLAKRSQNY